ncbi:MAG: ATP-binding cassette domain-containing protein [Myxococcales bacterium]|nr:ATP-binding cassette domain-containing protein [Myxococcales bacterium]
MSGPPLVIAEGLCKDFPSRRGQKVRAVDGVTFSALGGEVFGLLGVNGAGKTTTLRLLSTMLRPSAGEARVCGHSLLREAGEVRRCIGFLSAATGVYGRLTAREMVAYFGRLHGMDDRQISQRTEELFGRLQLEAFADVRCDSLSTGNRQKVSIVRAILHDPPLLILDEATAGLDVLASRAIVELVKDCRSRGKCVLFSTHRMDEVEALCDRVAIIHRGRLLSCSTLSEMRARAGGGRIEEAFVAMLGEAS